MRWAWCVAVLAVASPVGAHAAGDMLRTNDVIWSALSEAEKDRLRTAYVVDVASSHQYGTIIDAQAVDESTPGTNTGSAIGQAYGSAAYIDNAFKGPRPNYSATGHVGAALLGAIVGGALDAPAVRQFRFRYTVRSLDGSVTQIDRVEGQPFRHPAGVCVTLPSLSIVTSGICDTDINGFRTKYLSSASVAAPSLKERKARQSKASDGEAPPIVTGGPQQNVRCRLGMAGVVQVSISECRNAEGVVVE